MEGDQRSSSCRMDNRQCILSGWRHVSSEMTLLLCLITSMVEFSLVVMAVCWRKLGASLPFHSRLLSLDPAWVLIVEGLRFIPSIRKGMKLWYRNEHLCSTLVGGFPALHLSHSLFGAIGYTESHPFLGWSSLMRFNSLRNWEANLREWSRWVLNLVRSSVFGMVRVFIYSYGLDFWRRMALLYLLTIFELWRKKGWNGEYVTSYA